MPDVPHVETKLGQKTDQIRVILVWSATLQNQIEPRTNPIAEILESSFFTLLLKF